MDDEACRHPGCTRRAAFEGLCVIHDAEELFGVPFDDLVAGRTDHRLQPLFESLDTDALLRALKSTQPGPTSSRKLDPEFESRREAVERLPRPTQKVIAQVLDVYLLRSLLARKQRSGEGAEAVRGALDRARQS